jgi:hypothetical protein
VCGGVQLFGSGAGCGGLGGVLLQKAGWKVEQLADGIFRWTTPAGRSYDTEPTRYPI